MPVEKDKLPASQPLGEDKATNDAPRRFWAQPHNSKENAS
jgi:hypothetical protein